MSIGAACTDRTFHFDRFGLDTTIIFFCLVRRQRENGALNSAKIDAERIKTSLTDVPLSAATVELQSPFIGKAGLLQQRAPVNMIQGAHFSDVYSSNPTVAEIGRCLNSAINQAISVAPTLPPSPATPPIMCLTLMHRWPAQAVGEQLSVLPRGYAMHMRSS